ncbi:uncharacterized protein LAJ45_10589 [Morchella importuna]|uniref:uncharacterized protein n=1 Tax=Morchella importuna TaxID=1174673 RepID=UPI001E8CC668|nr:uncharacterized protein LAJ45_10589 [Morchella importuna]KAH8145309.1 hypothetical protein LAJ45_10589 [Morchella importuna]
MASALIEATINTQPPLDLGRPKELVHVPFPTDFLFGRSQRLDSGLMSGLTLETPADPFQAQTVVVVNSTRLLRGRMTRG